MQQLSSKDAPFQPDRSRLLSQLKKNSAPVAVIEKRSGNEPAPLSYAQERLWIMAQLEPDNPIYNVAGAMRFEGLLNQSALRQSLNEIMRRHQILRSRFIDGPYQAVQCVMSDSTLLLSELNLSNLRLDEAQALFHHCADGFIRSPFSLSDEPPLRGLLVQLSDQQHLLLLTLHHIVSDRWSVGVLMKEVAALYAAFNDGAPSPLPELPIQYGDFAAWQRRQGERWRKQLAYWTQKLADAPPLLELPTDRPRPPMQSYCGDLYRVEIPQSLTAAVKALGKQYNATLFMVMAAAFTTLLYRYAGSKDITLGYPTAGRNQAQAASLIGFFVNTLVLRSQLNDDLPFTALLERIREQALEDQRHQELSFGQLLEALNPSRNTAHSPLFQVMLAVQNVPMPDFRMQDLSTAPLIMNNRIAQFDLTLFVEERDGKLAGSFEYNADLFDATTIGRMAGHLQTLLTGIVNTPGLPLKHLPLMPPAETQQLLAGWSGYETAWPQQRLIHQLFEAQAQTTPDKAALAFAGHSISYGELDRRAQHWAERLQALGLGPECRVAVCAERSVELVIGLLAVLKAGAAYVPMDPGYPEDRLNYMLHDAGIELLLTQSALADKFRHYTVKMLCLDAEAGDIPAESQAARSTFPALSPDNTAYVIYTSGSTGRPKGVSVSHRNLLHSTWARVNYYREPLQCFLLLSSFAFDSSVAGIFWTLSQGGCLCLPQQEELTDPAALAGLISQHRVSHLLALPSFYTAIINDRNLPLLNSLQAVIVAGETCPGDIAAAHHRKQPAVPFYNEYGPTEGSVWSSVYRSLKEDACATLPIGRPIGNARLYILDRQLCPVPIGISGELCIGGAGLAQGYLNQPALTAEKFIPHPFGMGGERLYKTGDLARFRADGEIEFLGRIDNQVKIRGYRIELGEIENRLQQHPAIQEAAVLVKEEAGQKRLVAYLVGRQAAVPEALALQAYLKQTLPDYMVPSNYVGLDTLPLTPNGKRDYRRLLAMQALPQQASTLKPASNWVEAELAEIWREVLGLDAIGVDADFFAQGGHSLAVIQVKSRIQDVFNIDMPAKRLFDLSTIELLAAEIARLQILQQDDASLAELLKEIEQLSDEEVNHLLAIE
jgi:amino acid adenylation domain-containing protein